MRMAAAAGRHSCCSIQERVARRSSSSPTEATALYSRSASEQLRRDSTAAAWTEREWRRTLACRLYEERRPLSLTLICNAAAVDAGDAAGEEEEEMDFLWEAYEAIFAAAGEDEEESSEEKTPTDTVAREGEVQQQQQPACMPFTLARYAPPKMAKMWSFGLRRAASLRRRWYGAGVRPLRCSVACYGLRRDIRLCYGHDPDAVAIRPVSAATAKVAVSPPRNSLSRA